MLFVLKEISSFRFTLFFLINTILVVSTSKKKKKKIQNSVLSQKGVKLLTHLAYGPSGSQLSSMDIDFCLAHGGAVICSTSAFMC